MGYSSNVIIHVFDFLKTQKVSKNKIRKLVRIFVLKHFFKFIQNIFFYFDFRVHRYKGRRSNGDYII